MLSVQMVLDTLGRLILGSTREVLMLMDMMLVVVMVLDTLDHLILGSTLEELVLMALGKMVVLIDIFLLGNFPNTTLIHLYILCVIN
jgi:hypothetical protein